MRKITAGFILAAALNFCASYREWSPASPQPRQAQRKESYPPAGSRVILKGILRQRKALVIEKAAKPSYFWENCLDIGEHTFVLSVPEKLSGDGLSLLLGKRVIVEAVYHETPDEEFLPDKPRDEISQHPIEVDRTGRTWYLKERYFAVEKIAPEK